MLARQRKIGQAATFVTSLSYPLVGSPVIYTWSTLRRLQAAWGSRLFRHLIVRSPLGTVIFGSASREVTTTREIASGSVSWC